MPQSLGVRIVPRNFEFHEQLSAMGGKLPLGDGGGFRWLAEPFALKEIPIGGHNFAKAIRFKTPHGLGQWNPDQRTCGRTKAR